MFIWNILWANHLIMGTTFTAGVYKFTQYGCGKQNTGIAHSIKNDFNFNYIGLLLNNCRLPEYQQYKFIHI